MQVSAVQTYLINNIKNKNLSNNHNIGITEYNQSLPQINELSNVYYPTFGGNFKLKAAKKAYEKLSRNIENNTKLSQHDEKWVRKLRNLFGADSFTVNNPDNPTQLMTINSKLSIEKINQGNNMETLKNALKVMIAATEYKPNKIKLGGVTYNVHNKKIAGLLKEKYNLESFENLQKYLDSKRIFDMTDDSNYGIVLDKNRGIPKICGATENWDMSARSWITDIMRIGGMQKRERPETWTKALNTIGEYYGKQKDNFAKLIASPESYREGDALQGIPHIFLPKTLEPDSNWFNNKRLESHGLALKEFCNGIIDGIGKGKNYGYQSSESVPQNVLEAIDNLGKYFKAIDYSTAPSAGNWEEIPLKGGLTSDTEAIRSGFAAFKNLMYSPKYSNNSEMQKVRTRLSALNPLNQDEINKLIDDGAKRVRKTYLEEAPGIRPHDSSLIFVTTSDIKLSDNVIDDVKKHMEILESVEKNLVRKNGVIRYAPFNFKLSNGEFGSSHDSYLNLNYFNAIDNKGKLNLDWKDILDKFASKDCSEADMFFARAKLSTPNKEAQWFMVSDMSVGYGKQIEKLIKLAKKEKREFSKEEKQLIKILRSKQTEYLNRALARISDENPQKINQIKANGLDMPSVTVSEAMQYVSDVNGKTKMIQGTNAPLAWAVSSLYNALQEEKLIIKSLNI